MSRILSREGARPRVSGFFFKSAIQSVLIFGAETWVITPHMVRVLGGFQYQVARQLMGRMPRWRLGGRWEYTSAKAAREEAGFDPIKSYIWRWQNTVAQYIVM